MQHFSMSPREMVGTLWRNRGLVFAMIKRDVIGRYKGSVMGLMWSFINPLFMLAIYTYVFSGVFKARWHGGTGSKTEFALVLFAGLLAFNLFSECISRAPALIVSNTNYVKKVVFPLDILPVVTLGAGLFHMLVSLLVWLIFYLIFFGVPHLTVLLLPVVILPLLLITMGFSWLLASLGVYLRDIAQFIGVVVTALLFLSPIFYPVSALPPKFQHLLLINPITVVVVQLRDVLMWGRNPNWLVFGGYLVLSALIAWMGFAWFQKTRRGFADVL